MSPNPLIHFITHIWFWPLEFVLRPLAVSERFDNNWKIELITAIVGYTLLSTEIGIALWKMGYSDIYAIWILVVGVAAGVGAVAIAELAVRAVGVIVVIAGIVVITEAGVGAETVAIAVIGVGAITGAVARVGIGVGAVLWLILIFLGLSLFFHTSSIDYPIWLISLSLSLILGIMIGITYNLKTGSSHIRTTSGTLWLGLISTSSCIIFYNYQVNSLIITEDITTISIAIILIFILLTGLLVYPFIFFISLWQFRQKRINQHQKYFYKSLPFIWQSLALPLPFLSKYLQSLVKINCQQTWVALLYLQNKSFQGRVARMTGKKILQSETGLIFTAYIAQSTNRVNFCRLAYESNASISLLLLKPLYDNEWSRKNDKKVDLFLDSEILLNRHQQRVFEEIRILRKRKLITRIEAAKFYLDSVNVIDKKYYFRFLQQLAVFSQCNNIYSIAQLPLIGQINKYEGHINWLHDAWQGLIELQSFSQYLKRCFELESKTARKQFLINFLKKLKASKFENLSEFWAELIQELAQEWSIILVAEIKQMREWLALDIELVSKETLLGDNDLQFVINNTSRSIADKLSLELDSHPQVHWMAQKLNYPRLLEPNSYATLRINANILKSGKHIIHGWVFASDLEGREYQWPINLSINSNDQASQYQLSEKSYYIVGAQLDTDQAFVGRKKLLHDIHLLWSVPEQKTALLMVGLRRMGKSSLLFKLRRDGINPRIIPIIIDLQGEATSHYAFWQLVTEKISQQLTIQTPTLDKDETDLSFRQFIHSSIVQNALAQRFILLMLDEANYLNDKDDCKRNYGTLSHNLRSLMQSPDTPILVLFCGTHELLEGGTDYDSILFNTATVKNVSYLNAHDAAEVLTRPVGSHIDYDPQALQLAFELSAGHPYLLQALGKQVIDNFDAVLFEGKHRSNYVVYKDMEQAGKNLAKQANQAFSNYWDDSNDTVRKIKSILAWYLDETSRTQITLEQFFYEAKTLQIQLARKETIETLERLCREDILVRTETGYRFLIALYRRWLARRYQPEFFRGS